jgi:predicted ATPase/serine/threonine protein kinase
MAADLREGSEVAGYRIEALIARGGMGVVYRATQLSLEREVALKLIAPELASQEAFRSRFLREAKLAASLEHPHVLPVYEAGEVEGQLFLALRYVEGADLGSLLAQGPLPPETSRRIVTQLCSALQAAHKRGLLHRDVKPENVLLLGREGEEHAYLTDFGLAKPQAERGLTQTGALLGSLAYLAPEQIEKGQSDERTDLYALGCLLYACLTGKPPFVREHEAALLWAHLKEAPPKPSEARPELGDAFDWVIERALAKDPGDRFQSAAELAQALAADAPMPLQPRPAPPAPTNLPRPASSFVGRERELDEVVSLIAQPDIRLLTLTGPGGTGKTRLALEAAKAVDRFPDGVFWVGLASLRDPALVAEQVAQTLGAKDGLAEHVGERELLLLLDNLEQVIEAAPELSSLLQACPNLTLLVTSRELLRVQGEVEYPVPPLQEPEAVSLFCDRAQLEPSDDIRELCTRLDNLPLAVELAAARAKALSPAQILARLSGRLDLLKGGRDADPRQQTLRATIEWSYALLSPEEQRLVARLSVFAGGCTLEAAEEVAFADLDTLQSLVEKSLLRFINERHWMLETIREYAGERLNESNEADEMRQRHADWLLRLASDAELALRGSDAEAWLSKLDNEQENLRLGLAWMGAAGLVESQLDLISGVWSFWETRGYFREGLHWAEEVLARSDGMRTTRREEVLVAAALLALEIGETERARELADEGLAVARELHDPVGVIRALMALALYALSIDELDEAERRFGEAIVRARHANEHRVVAWATGSMADLALRQGDCARAIALAEEALALFREIGLQEGVAFALYNLALAQLRDRLYDDAAASARESLAISQRLGDIGTIGWNLLLLGSLAARRDAYEPAATLVGAADALRQGVGLVLTPTEREIHDETETELRKVLGERRYEAANSTGRAMTVDEAVAYALSSLD